MAIQQKLRTKGNAVSGSVGGKEGADSRAVLLAFLRESQDFPYCLARALLAYQQPGMQEAEGLGLWLFDFLELGTSWGWSPRAEGPHQGECLSQQPAPSPTVASLQGAVPALPPTQRGAPHSNRWTPTLPMTLQAHPREGRERQGRQPDL